MTTLLHVVDVSGMGVFRVVYWIYNKVTCGLLSLLAACCKI